MSGHWQRKWIFKLCWRLCSCVFLSLFSVSPSQVTILFDHEWSLAGLYLFFITFNLQKELIYMLNEVSKCHGIFFFRHNTCFDLKNWKETCWATGGAFSGATNWSSEFVVHWVVHLTENYKFHSAQMLLLFLAENFHKNYFCRVKAPHWKVCALYELVPVNARRQKKWGHLSTMKLLISGMVKNQM